MEFDKAKKFAAYLLSSKTYTCKEMYQKLIIKKFDSEVAEQIVSKLCEAGVLNDEEYAKMYVHDAVNIHMKGAFRIRQELLKKGVASSLIDKALGEFDDDVEEQLNEYVKLRFLDKVFEDYRDIEKAKSHLLRRGYGLSEINKCFNRLGIRISRGDWD